MEVEVVNLEDFQVLLHLQVKMVVLVVAEADLTQLPTEEKEREILPQHLLLKDKMVEQVMDQLVVMVVAVEDPAEQEHLLL